MALKIDSPTLSLWNSSGVKAVRVRFVSGGCAGTKVSVVPESVTDSQESPFFEQGGIRVRFDESDRGLLQDARLTRVEKNGKEVWLYAAQIVKGRCGCGSSFTFDAEKNPVSKHDVAPKIDLKKLAELKNAFKK